MVNTKYGKGKGKLLLKIEEISGGKEHTNTWKLIQDILMITDVFLNQKRVNVCEHMVKMVSCDAIFIVRSHIFTLVIEKDVCDC
jgi:hypothetical protein